MYVLSPPTVLVSRTCNCIHAVCKLVRFGQKDPCIIQTARVLQKAKLCTSFGDKRAIAAIIVCNLLPSLHYDVMNNDDLKIFFFDSYYNNDRTFYESLII